MERYIQFMKYKSYKIYSGKNGLVWRGECKRFLLVSLSQLVATKMFEYQYIY